MDNRKLSKDILHAVGGEQNVVSVSHCMTRLRLTLADTNAAQPVDEIKKIPGVLGVAVLGDQYQIVIGPGVEQVYMAFKELGSFEDAGTVENVAAKKIGRALVCTPATRTKLVCRLLLEKNAILTLKATKLPPFLPYLPTVAFNTSFY